MGPPPGMGPVPMAPGMGGVPMGPGMMPIMGMDPQLQNRLQLEALAHYRQLKEQQAFRDRFNLEPEPPLRRVRYLDDWLKLHFNVIQRLVEEPMFAEPRPGEPCMQVKICSAQLWGPWPHPFQQAVTRPFVRHYIDTEMIGETQHAPYSGDSSMNFAWNETQLFLPRGAKVSQFELLVETPPDGRGLPLSIGDVALSTETLWYTARNAGPVKVQLPILFDGREVGKMELGFSQWDGRPLKEENAILPQQKMFGTVAAAADRDDVGPYANQGLGSYGNSQIYMRPQPSGGSLLFNGVGAPFPRQTPFDPMGPLISPRA